MKHIRYHQHILLLFTLTLFACGGKKSTDSANAVSQNGLVTFHLNAPPSTVEPLLLSELADSVSYVALETTKETLTSFAYRFGERYYSVSVSANEDRLICFDKSGKYLHQIGRRGNGPEEYMWISCRPDPITNRAYCDSNEKTLVYDENGKFVKSIKREKGWDFFPKYVYNDLAYFIPTDIPAIEIVDFRTNQRLTNNKVAIEKNMTFWTEQYKKHSDRISYSGGTELISKSSKDAFYCWSVFYDTVMMAKGKEVKPLCRIIPENKYTMDDLFNKDSKAFLLQPLIIDMEVCNNKLLLFVAYFKSIDDYSAYRNQHETNCMYLVVCDLKNGSVTYHPYYIINDLDGGPNVMCRYNMISNLSVEDLKNDEEIYNSYFTPNVEAKLKDQEGKFQRLFEPLADDANPIIRTFHWKE